MCQWATTKPKRAEIDCSIQNRPAPAVSRTCWLNVWLKKSDVSQRLMAARGFNLLQWVHLERESTLRVSTLRESVPWERGYLEGMYPERVYLERERESVPWESVPWERMYLESVPWESVPWERESVPRECTLRESVPWETRLVEMMLSSHRAHCFFC